MLNNLSFSYYNKKVFNNLSLEILPGTISVLRGCSGRGKSTLLKIMAGVIRADIQFGYSFTDAIYICAEDPFINHLSLKKNLQLIGNGYYEWCEKLALTDLMENKPSEMSFGQRVRANVVCSIISNKQIILLDEITQGNDPVNVQRILDCLLEAKRIDRTVIIATHDPRVDSIADRTFNV